MLCTVPSAISVSWMNVWNKSKEEVKYAISMSISYKPVTLTLQRMRLATPLTPEVLRLAVSMRKSRLQKAALCWRIMEGETSGRLSRFSFCRITSWVKSPGGAELWGREKVENEYYFIKSRSIRPYTRRRNSEEKRRQKTIITSLINKAVYTAASFIRSWAGAIVQRVLVSS